MVKQPVCLLIASGTIALSPALWPSQAATAATTMAYREFIAQVEADKINRVALTSDRTKAVITQDGQPIEVDLPADQGLIDTLTKNNVEITVQAPPDSSFFWRVTQSLGIPILLIAAPVLLVILLFGRKFMRR